ncbi:MAG: sugar nucleotide-binding protein, partial [Planctomycetota bacterium]
MPALRILVTGGSGFLAGHLVAAVRQAGHVAVTTGRSGGDIAVDLTARGMVAAVVEAARPDVALHLAACSRLADCERDPAMARAVNVGITAALAERLGARLLVVSTDLVFDGRGAPYAVTAPVSPLSVYGATKAEAEEVARAGA